MLRWRNPKELLPLRILRYLSWHRLPGFPGCTTSSRRDVVLGLPYLLWLTVRPTSPTHLFPAVVMNGLLAFGNEVPIQLVGRLQVVAISHRHLPRRLAVGHTTEPRPHCRKNGYFDLMLRGSAVGVDRQQGGPGGAVDLVGPFDAPRDPHRRGVGQKRNCRVAGGQRRSGVRARQLLSGT